MTVSKIARRALIGALTALSASLWVASPALAAGKPRVAIETDKGTIVVELEDKKAPITAANFLAYVDRHRFDGGQFFQSDLPRLPFPRGQQLVGADHPAFAFERLPVGDRLAGAVIQFGVHPLDERGQGIVSPDGDAIDQPQPLWPGFAVDPDFERAGRRLQFTITIV